jgi:glutathione S-transferase
MEPLTLYVDGYFANPYDATCYVALVEKQLEFSIARALLRDGGGVPAGLQAQTGVGRVPALRHGDFFLTESIAIAEYLEDVFPPPGHAALYPADARARARARQIAAFVRFDLRALREERPWTGVLWPAARRPLSAAAERDARELVDLARLARLGIASPWSIAHVDLALALSRLDDASIPEDVRAFMAATLSRPSVRGYLDHPRPPHPPP